MRWLFIDIRVIISDFDMVINCEKQNMILPVAGPLQIQDCK